MKTIFYIFCIILSNTFSVKAQNTLLWRVEGKKSSSSSYLYGTMHSKSETVFQYCEEVPKAIESCEGFVAELNLDSSVITGATKYFLMPEGYSLKKLLDSTEYDAVSKLVKKELGISLGLFDRMYPIYVLTMLSESDMMKGDKKAFLDQYLFQYAKLLKKQTGGLESIAEQSSALSSLPIAEQKVMLVEGVNKFEKEKKKNDLQKAKLLEYYTAGNINGLIELFQDADMPKEMADKLLKFRNEKMANRIDSLLNIRTTFCAIGAAHLPGDNGVIQLLRNKGYNVTPVECPFDGKGFPITQAIIEPPKIFEFPESHFKSYFPKQPIKTTNQREVDGKLLDLTTFEAISQNNLPGCVVIYIPLKKKPNHKEAANIRKHLILDLSQSDGAMSLMMQEDKELRGTLTAFAKWKNRKQQMIHAQSMVFQDQAFLIYAISETGTEYETKFVEKFFDSFSFIP